MTTRPQQQQQQQDQTESFSPFDPFFGKAVNYDAAIPRRLTHNQTPEAARRLDGQVWDADHGMFLVRDGRIVDYLDEWGEPLTEYDRSTGALNDYGPGEAILNGWMARSSRMGTGQAGFAIDVGYTASQAMGWYRKNIFETRSGLYRDPYPCLPYSFYGPGTTIIGKMKSPQLIGDDPIGTVNVYSPDVRHGYAVIIEVRDAECLKVILADMAHEDLVARGDFVWPTTNFAACVKGDMAVSVAQTRVEAYGGLYALGYAAGKEVADADH